MALILPEPRVGVLLGIPHGWRIPGPLNFSRHKVQEPYGIEVGLQRTSSVESKALVLL